MTFFFPSWTKHYKKHTYFELVDATFFVKDPPWGSSIEYDLAGVDNVIIYFTVCFWQLFRQIVLFFGELFDVYQLYRLVLAETYHFT